MSARDIASALAAAALAASTAADAAPADVLPLDGYAATVNARVVTVGDVLQFAAPVDRQIRLSYEGDAQTEKLRESHRRALDALIERALMVEEFGRRGFSLPDRVVDDYLNQIVHERFDGNRAAFLQALLGDGTTLDEFRDKTRENLSVMLLRRQEVQDRVAVPPQRAHEEYRARIDRYRVPEQVRLRVIGIHLGATDGDRALKRELAASLRQRLAAGEDFAALARQFSEAAKAAEGGDWGWVDPATLRPELAAAARALATGSASDVVEAGDYAYVLRVDARQPASVKTFEEVRAEIEKDLRAREEERIYREWIAALEARHYVRRFEWPDAL